MQKYLFALNHGTKAFSSNIRSSLASKSGSLALLSNTQNLLSKYKLNILLSLFGFYATKEIICDDKVLAPNTSSQLYAWGGNQYGQLGIGSDLTKPTPERVESIENIDIVGIGAKPLVSGALSKDGLIFTWGSGQTGALGHQNTSFTNMALPALLESLTSYKFTQLGCGRYHMAAITENGQLYTWGTKDHGVLGREIKLAPVSSKKSYDPKSAQLASVQPPGKVEGDLKDKTCVQVSCGTHHTVCLTSDHQVYTWGGYRGDALGYLIEQDVSLPKKVDFLDDKKVVKIATGADFTYALTQDGKIYSWGNNYFGQLGSQSGNSAQVPTLISSLYGTKIVDIACGDNFGAAISDKGKLFTWGYGNEGQLGHGNKNDVKTPKLLEFNKKIASVNCGSAHTGIITSDGELYMFGRGREGQLGRADAIESSVTYRMTPQKIETFKKNKVISVACGGDHTIALVQ